MDINFEHLDAIVKTGGHWYACLDGFKVVRGDETTFVSNEWLAGIDKTLSEAVRFLCDMGGSVPADTVAAVYVIHSREIHVPTTLGDYIAVAIIRKVEVDDDSVVFIGNGAPYRKMIRPADGKAFVRPLGYRPSSFEVSREWLDTYYEGWLQRFNHSRALDYSLYDAVKHMLSEPTKFRLAIIPDDIVL